MRQDVSDPNDPVPPARRSKFLRPPLPPGAQERARLRALLDRSARLPLTLVVAPAGSGKTVALAQWALRRPDPVGWLTVDPGDAALPRLADTLATAVGSVDPDAGRAVAARWRAEPDPSPAALAAAADAALAEPGPPVVLVLDDAHAAGGAFPDLLWHLVRQPIPRLHLVVSGRTEPPVPLQRLRLQGLLTEIGPDQLRFAPREIAQLAEQRVYGQVGDALTDLLARETAGWPAGVRLMLDAIDGLDDAAEAADRVRSGSVAIDRYLGEEVIDRQPPELADFLLRTALLETVSPNLAAVLLDGPDATARADRLFDDLLARRLFLVPEPGGGGFRYQPFLRRALLARAGARLPEADRRDLLGRAARWHAAHAQPGAAIRCLLAAGEPEAAADLAEAATGPALLREEWAGPLAWLGLLPRETLRARPLLLAAQAWIAQFSGRPHLSLAIHDELAASVDFPPQTAATVEALAEVLRDSWFLPIEQDPAGAAARLDRAVAAIPPGERLGHGLAVCLRARAHAALGYPDESIAELTAWGEAQAGPVDAVTARGQWMVALAHWQTGDLRAWRQAAERVRAMAAASRLVISEGWAETDLGSIAYEEDRIADAIAHLERARAHRPVRHVAQTANASALLALALEADGRRAAADAVLADARAEVEEQRAYGVAALMAGPVARLALARGEDLQPHLDALAPLGIDTVSLYSAAQPTLVRAMLLVAHGGRAALAAARALLDVTEARAATCHNDLTLLRVWALQALAHEAAGRPGAALERACRSLELGAPNGFRRTYLDLRPGFLPLAERVAAARPEIGGIDALVADLAAASAPGRARRPAPVGRRAGGPSALDLLTIREEEVLKALCARLSYKEIGSRLSISPVTVKHHLGSVYAKLGVRTGREAILRATDLGWCDAE